MKRLFFTTACIAASLSGCALAHTERVLDLTRMGTAVESRLSQAHDIGGRRITPLAIVEDSRCPSSVQCIQAGTVRLQVSVRVAALETRFVVGLSSPANIGDAWLHLIQACPYPSQPGALAEKDYRFVLAIAGSWEMPRVATACDK